MNSRNETAKVLMDVIDAGEKVLKASKEVLKYADILLGTMRSFHTALTEDSEEKPVLPESGGKTQEEAETHTFTKEDVRSVLSEKSAAGYRKEVIALLEKYDAMKLIELSEEHYADVIREAKEIGNE